MPSAQDLKFLAGNFVFLSGYFVPLWIPTGIYLAWSGWIPWYVGAVFLVLVVLETVIPLPKRPHFNHSYCRHTGFEQGMKSYCQGELRIAVPFEKDKNYLIGLAPHGLWSMCYHLLWPQMIDRFGITPMFVGADILLKIPFLKRHFTAYGLIGASRKDLLWAMEQPHPFNVLCMVPGGIAEMFYGISREQIILRKRKGFVKLALQKGAYLVPAYGFGTNQQFHRLVEAGGFMAKVSSALKLSATPWVDRFYIPFGPIPTRHKIIMAVGAPIPVEKVEDPTPEQVNALHDKFCDAMRALFDEHKGDMGWQDKRLYFEDEDPTDSANAAAKKTQ
mmetsp:Transcript_70621/g.169220  ORF Transcript_70621/g.169220 Transcript_70621/m.169220 type:complete len:332 (-) Transcript_70621:159-1154(-)